MKILIILFTLLFNTFLMAGESCDLMPVELDGKSLNNISDFGYDDEDEDIIFTKIGEAVITEELRQLVIKIGEVNEECLAEDIDGDIFKTKTGKVFTAYYSTDDYCDGGNYAGFIADANAKPVAIIGDSDFYCLWKR